MEGNTVDPSQKTPIRDIVLTIALMPFVVMIWCWNKLVDAIFN